MSHFYFRFRYRLLGRLRGPHCIRLSNITASRAIYGGVITSRQILKMAAVRHIGSLFLHAGQLTNVIWWLKDAFAL